MLEGLEPRQVSVVQNRAPQAIFYPMTVKNNLPYVRSGYNLGMSFCPLTGVFNGSMVFIGLYLASSHCYN
jgi:hypothetical protein